MVESFDNVRIYVFPARELNSCHITSSTGGHNLFYGYVAMVTSVVQYIYPSIPSQHSTPRSRQHHTSLKVRCHAIVDWQQRCDMKPTLGIYARIYGIVQQLQTG